LLEKKRPFPSKKKKQRLFTCNRSTNFLRDSCGYLFQKILQCIKVSNRNHETGTLGKYRFSRNCRHLMPLFKVKEKMEQGRTGYEGRARTRNEEEKKEKDTRCTDVSSRHRVAWPSTCREWWALHDSREETAKKKKKKETFYGHGGSCCCLFAVGQRRRGDRGIEENHQFVDRN